MLERTPEPELMDEPEQARAYAEADFAEPHERFVELFRETFPGLDVTGRVLDLGCGPADIVIRFARAFPECRIDGLDAGPNMLALGREAVAAAGLAGRVRLLEGYLPGAVPPEARYDAIISNSLLHHMAAPMALWQTVRDHAAPGAPVFVMDLMRPASADQAQALVDAYAEGEPEVLRQDFRNSLHASYTPDEVAGQLQAAGLDLTVEAVSDRHLLVHGWMP